MSAPPSRSSRRRRRSSFDWQSKSPPHRGLCGLPWGFQPEASINNRSYAEPTMPSRREVWRRCLGVMAMLVCAKPSQPTLGASTLIVGWEGRAWRMPQTLGVSFARLPDGFGRPSAHRHFQAVGKFGGGVLGVGDACFRQTFPTYFGGIDAHCRLGRSGAEDAAVTWGFLRPTSRRVW
jgi:hypothetical protein